MKTILALGADIKNKFLLAKGRDFYFGPDISDLSDAGNYEFFKKEVKKTVKKERPDIIACDLHPGYFSTRFASEYGSRITEHRLLHVQHHHAHIASVIEEHALKGPVIGVSFDGTGYGTDGNIWGGEFLIAGRKGFERAAHLRYWKMPGGDKAVSEPWRMVLSILDKKGTSCIKKVGKKDKELVLSMISGNINTPLTSSAGRLFDAAAALLGVCQYASYEAEGPIKLESMCGEGVKGSYGFKISPAGDCDVIETEGLFLGMVEDIKKGKDKSIIATKFHNSMVEIVVRTVKSISKRCGIKDIVLSGGVFQNRFLKKNVMKRLKGSGYNVFTNEGVPVNDLNIAIGQYHVARGEGVIARSKATKQSL